MMEGAISSATRKRSGQHALLCVCKFQGSLGSDVEPTSGTVYRSKQELIEAGLHQRSSSDAYCKDIPEYHVFSVLSGGPRSTQKDMGGLLQEDKRDFLVYRLGSKLSKAMWASKRSCRNIHVIRRFVKSDAVQLVPHQRPAEATPYIYCGKYEVSDGWTVDSNAYFKLLRLPGQPPLVPLQMAFRSNSDDEARSFHLTREVYKSALLRDCSQPCKRIDACSGSGNGVEQGAMLEEYNLCDVCGMSDGGPGVGCHGTMEVCGCCLDDKIETLACSTCMPGELRRWLHADPDNRHWRCKRCRVAGKLPLHGCIFEDRTPFLHAHHPETPTPTAAVLPSSLLHSAAPTQMTHAAQQLAAPLTSDEQIVIELSDSSSQSMDCKNQLSRSNNDDQCTPSVSQQDSPDQARRMSTRVIKTPKRLLTAGSCARQQKRKTEATPASQSTPASATEPVAAMPLHAQSKPSTSACCRQDCVRKLQDAMDDTLNWLRTQGVGNFLPKRKHEEASSSEALTSSLGLYKQMFPTSAAAGVMDDVVAGMEQAVLLTVCTEELNSGSCPSKVLQDFARGAKVLLDAGANPLKQQGHFVDSQLIQQFYGSLKEAAHEAQPTATRRLLLSLNNKLMPATAAAVEAETLTAVARAAAEQGNGHVSENVLAAGLPGKNFTPDARKAIQPPTAMLSMSSPPPCKPTLATAVTTLPCLVTPAQHSTSAVRPLLPKLPTSSAAAAEAAVPVQAPTASQLLPSNNAEAALGLQQIPAASSSQSSVIKGTLAMPLRLPRPAFASACLPPDPAASTAPSLPRSQAQSPASSFPAGKPPCSAPSQPAQSTAFLSSRGGTSATVSVAMACQQLATGTAGTGAGVAAGAVPLQIHAPAGHREASRLSVALACSLPLPNVPAPAVPFSCDAVAQQIEGGLPSLSQPASTVPTLAHELLQGPILPKAPAPLDTLHGSVQSAVPLPTTVLPSACAAMPDSIMDLVSVVNNQMGSQQMRHHITQSQAMHLEEVFGDVEMLLGLAGMEDKPLNNVLRSDGKLNPLQILSMRRLLRTLLP